MRPVWTLLVAGVVAFVAVAFVLTFIQKYRLEAARVQSQHHLRQLAFAVLEVQTDTAGAFPVTVQAIPAATVVLAGVPAEQRLSWYAPILPRLDQRSSGAAEALRLLDVQQPWTAPSNQQAARVLLKCAVCPLAERQALSMQFAPAHYVAIAGVGADAASLKLADDAAPPARAGPWRYDAPTPLAAIRDGLSNTLLLGETSYQIGSWLRGGWTTTRGLDASPSAPPLLGPAGQFGGFFPQGGHFAFCDASVRLLSGQISPDVLLQLAAMADNWNLPPQ
ncbi:MAG: DUF1559 domain-containing protein [Thermogemmata sp.]|nr:DUF1559 domain-containing protein [Thermogemmata sp.]